MWVSSNFKDIFFKWVSDRVVLVLGQISNITAIAWQEQAICEKMIMMFAFYKINRLNWILIVLVQGRGGSHNFNMNCSWRSSYQEGREGGITLTPPKVCASSKSCVIVFFVCLISWVWGVIARFDDIGGIIYHHCLYLLLFA